MKTISRGWAAEIADNGEKHVMPLCDEREHRFKDCWCRPTPDESDDRIIVHHALDQRERYETAHNLN